MGGDTRRLRDSRGERVGDGRAHTGRTGTINGGRWLRRAERVSFVAGALLVGFVGFAYVDSVSANRAALDAFDAAIAASTTAVTRENREPDQGLWSAKRREAYQANEQADLGTPAAVLRIPSIELEAPVFNGTDKVSLNRGVGHVEGSERPGTPGNVAIAGHRDSYFRGLKDVLVGEFMELETLAGIDQYRISEILIVDPLDMSVLEPTDTDVLTLITCYPFYYVGYAPDRYIVRGMLETSSPRRPATSSGGEPILARGVGPKMESDRL